MSGVAMGVCSRHWDTISKKLKHFCNKLMCKLLWQCFTCGRACSSWVQVTVMYENAVREKEGVIGKLALLEEGRRRLVDETTAAEQKHREDTDVSVPSSHMYIMYIRGVVVHCRHNITQSDCILLSLVSLRTHKVPHSRAPPSSCDQCHSPLFTLCRICIV